MKYLPDGYYSELARINQVSPFLSPSRDSVYASEVASWLCSIECREPVLMEVGPGYGEIVSMLDVSEAPEAEVWLIDTCAEFLDISSSRFSGPHSQLRLLRADLEHFGLTDELNLKRHVHRLAAINVIQDVDAEAALKLFASWMRPAGKVWLTVLAKETMDEYYRNNPLYDSTSGFFYKPQTGPVRLGVLNRSGTFSYERILRFHTRSDITKLLTKEGFAIERSREITYPATDMLSRWESMNTLHLFPAGVLGKLRESGVYVDAYEFVAQWIG